jgi:hypothetical protein
MAQFVFGSADEIFSVDRELLTAVNRSLRIARCGWICL